MTTTIETLMARCDALEANLPSAVAEYECPNKRMEAFAGLTEDILHDAARSDDPHDHCIAHLAIQHQVEAILTSAFWIPKWSN